MSINRILLFNNLFTGSHVFLTLSILYHFTQAVYDNKLCRGSDENLKLSSSDSAIPLFWFSFFPCGFSLVVLAVFT